jgi:hypothetical protein
VLGLDVGWTKWWRPWINGRAAALAATTPGRNIDAEGVVPPFYQLEEVAMVDLDLEDDRSMTCMPCWSSRTWQSTGRRQTACPAHAHRGAGEPSRPTSQARVAARIGGGKGFGLGCGARWRLEAAAGEMEPCSEAGEDGEFLSP